MTRAAWGGEYHQGLLILPGELQARLVAPHIDVAHPRSLAEQRAAMNAVPFIGERNSPRPMEPVNCSR